MRIGAVFNRRGRSFPYRVSAVLGAMEWAGHDIAATNDGRPDVRELATCDVVYVHGRSDPRTRDALARLGGDGTPAVFDSGGDVSADAIATARLAVRVTAATAEIATAYERDGVRAVAVIPNQLFEWAVRPPRPHDGLVVGWAAMPDRIADAEALGLRDALQRLLDRHDELAVECIGVDLRLRGRYRHRPVTALPQLFDHIAGFDVGIAPRAHAPEGPPRSDIKVQEYAACGVPWLASAREPYRRLGEPQGGMLVADEEWPAVLDEIVTNQAQRVRLAQNAARWAPTQTFPGVAGRWEQVLLDAAGRSAEARRPTLRAVVEPGKAPILRRG
ncbi:MAG TPA: glycosyltransferase [Capillimicrobium sp.]|nr:glycosyltransferase [Capillimicrobium sp.]